ncbi:MAG: hypothetical protein IH983_08025 [Planctomycetes bacterium]|nr:hypothetical protein [Planctomycetota bacterium]
MSSSDPDCVRRLANAIGDVLSAVNRQELAQRGYERVDDGLTLTGRPLKPDGDTFRNYDEIVGRVEAARQACNGVDGFVRPLLGTKQGAWTTKVRADLADVKVLIDLAGCRVPTAVREFDELIDSIRARMVFLADLDTSAVTTDKATGSVGRPPQITEKEANIKARQLAEADPGFVNKSAMEWADDIECSVGTVYKTAMWKRTMEQTGRGRKDRPARPKVVNLPADELLGRGSKDEVLKGLIAQQRADDEPSPLDDDPSLKASKVRKKA